MSQYAAETNAITTQPLISPMNIAEGNPVMENMANLPVSADKAAAVITTQPMMTDPTDEEQEEKRQQRSEDFLETVNEVAEDCTWCCFTCADPNICDCTGCDNCCTGCGDCCNDCSDCFTGCGDCCTGCCEDGPSADTIDVDGNDVAGCLECCGSCFECCSD